jgi:hypothetical protein
LKIVKVTQILNHEDIEKIIAPPWLLDSSCQDQKTLCSFTENPLPNQK